MRHLISIALLIAAVAAYAFGFGPFFFGAPLLGTVLLLIGFGLEITFWLRVRRRAS